ncbi:MAG TPA: bifunctional (p)ppGpp synthetase/guanosine-3',5'-bis(diphosphate) 3'-pyrophosphohydrolase [Gaiellaceae bacterium]|jgi:GTP pyrophosphokinase|nr:bifunctional (p)ppGpp synthetase/guanosine-3',5'-bis(diphosphate) 3'-pyrophosphohydrolase [Gaiellaceae bacterium]
MTVLESAERHHELIDELIETVAAYNKDVDRELLTRAFRFAATAHEGQQRRSGEDFINHPWGAAKICAELRLDEQTIAAALLHDVVEDTDTDIKEVRDEFGDEIAQLVEGVTKLTRIQFQSREQAEAENYRKMIVAMAQDVRVILIKLADRLHNMRTIEYLGKQKQVQKAKETLEVYAPLAHRLGINKLKWELEDLAFATLHPRKYEEIKAMVTERRADREEHVREAAMTLQRELEKVDIPADIAGRAKHFYSIYDKMAKKGREFNEIYDLTAMRVIAERGGEEGTRDCYGALGLIHSLWKPMPGRFKDYVAMPKLNGYQALHTTVIGPEGRPLEIQVRTREMHETAEFGVAAHWLYKHGRAGKSRDDEWVAWVRTLMDWQEDEADPREFIKTFRTDLFEDEVYVFTPKGEVKALPAGSTPIDFAYAVHTDVGHRTVGAKINGRIVPLHYRLKSGDFVEILTTKSGRGPSRDWISLAASSRARNKIRQWFSRETREETEHKGRETLETALKKQNLPYRKLQGSAVLAQVIRESGFKKAEDFYIALGSGKLQPGQIVNKVIQRLKTEQVVEEEAVPLKAPKARHTTASENFGIAVRGVDDVLVRLAKCCTPLPGDPIVGYISLGKGITIHREDCSNVKALMRNPERFTAVSWDGGATQSFRVQISVDSWDRPRLLEDVARTFSEHGANIVEYGGHVEDQLAKNWYVAEVGDVKALRSLLTALRNVDAVFDAYRVTPS